LSEAAAPIVTVAGRKKANILMLWRVPRFSQRDREQKHGETP